MVRLQVILDFYQFEDIYAAKKLLLEAVDSWKSDIRLPHVPTRCEGKHSLSQIVGWHFYCHNVGGQEFEAERFA